MDSVCVGPIKYTGQAELQRDIDNFKAALGGVNVEEAFIDGRKIDLRSRHTLLRDKYLEKYRHQK